MNTQGKDMVERGKDAADAGETALREEIERLREQVEGFVGDAARSGRKQLRRAGSGARDVARAGGDLIGGMGHELQLAEDRAAETVRARPLQSLGLAIGFGFLLAVVLRR